MGDKNDNIAISFLQISAAHTSVLQSTDRINCQLLAKYYEEPNFALNTLFSLVAEEQNCTSDTNHRIDKMQTGQKVIFTSKTALWRIILDVTIMSTPKTLHGHGITSLVFKASKD